MKSTLRHTRLTTSLTPSLPSRYICIRCRTSRLLSTLPRTSPLRTLLPLTTQRHASSDTEQKSAKDRLAEGLRKRVWGTEVPPGPRDPYQPLTPEEREKQEEEREAAREEEIAKQADADAKTEAVAAAGGEGDYVPATTWEGLERIGGAEGWWEEEWDREHQFEGFLTGPKIEHEQAEATVRRVLVELLALQNTGRPVLESSMVPIESSVDYDDVDIVVSTDGRAQLSYKDPVIEADLLESLQLQEQQELNIPLSEEDESLKEDEVDSWVATDAESQIQQSEDRIQALHTQIEETRQIRAQTLEDESGNDYESKEQGQPWHTIPLNDLEFKFAFVKRLMQLSGIRIPDPKINQFATVGDVVAHLAEKPKPKKLAEVLLSNPELMALPNVEVFERRHTPIDKEKEVGRWKLIEEELVRRGLPVTGNHVN